MFLFEVAAIGNPAELEMYLLNLSFSLSRKVNEKSIIIPEKPKIANFRNLYII
jgi:hypothetical protein